MVPLNVQYTKRASASLRRIFTYLALNAIDDEEYLKNTAGIIDALEALAVNPLLGIQLKGHPAEHRYWLIANKRYRVYYERLSPVQIIVVEIRGVKQKPLSDAELKRFFGL
jgi:plasmid stabilization system protein ParE